MIKALMAATGFGRTASLIMVVAGGLLVSGLAVKTWFYFHDRGVIAEHEAEITLEVAEKTLSAERSADKADRAIEARNRARASAIDERMTDAILTYPEAAGGSVGPVTQSALDGLRDEGTDPPADSADRAD